MRITFILIIITITDLYMVSVIQKKEPRLTIKEPKTIYNTITTLVNKISSPIGSPEETSYLRNYKNGPKKDDIGWSCSIKSVQMLLAYYFKKWNIEQCILSLIYKENGPLSIHSFIRKCIQNKCSEQAGLFWCI